MRYVFFLVFYLLSLGGVSHAASYSLEMSQPCNGDTGGRYPITGWNGDSRRAFSTRVYDFNVDCGGYRQHIMDVFLSTVDPNRYQRRGGTLYKHTGDERKSVMVRDRNCQLVPETVEVDPPSSNPCYYDIMHPDCDPSRKYYETRMVRRCSRAQYETRYVAKWEPFPTGYSPLPQGARIVKAAGVGTTGSTASDDSNIGTIILAVILLGITAFVWKPVARFYYSAFVPHPAKKFLDRAISNNEPLDMQGFERAMLQGTTMPFQDVFSVKAAKLRQALDEHAAMMRSVEERERARTLAKASAHFGKQIDEDYS
jgi:hypothetical protein